jgi:hypothetical protein
MRKPLMDNGRDDFAEFFAKTFQPRLAPKGRNIAAMPGMFAFSCQMAGA